MSNTVIRRKNTVPYKSYIKKHEKTNVLSVKFPEAIIKKMDELINAGFYRNRSELIRDAVRKTILEYEYLKKNWQRPIPL